MPTPGRVFQDQYDSLWTRDEANLYDDLVGFEYTVVRRRLHREFVVALEGLKAEDMPWPPEKGVSVRGRDISYNGQVIRVTPTQARVFDAITTASRYNASNEFIREQAFEGKSVHKKTISSYCSKLNEIFDNEGGEWRRMRIESPARGSERHRLRLPPPPVELD